LTLTEAYRGASAGPGSASVHANLGGVRPGDQFDSSVGVFVVAQAVADVVTLTSDTGVNPSASYSGKFRRLTW